MTAQTGHALTSPERGWRLFDLRYRNLQSISKAQKVHLTTLLILMTLFWTWYFSGGKEITVQGVPLSAQGVWVVLPMVLTFFGLAFIGSINAALPAKKKLTEVAEELRMQGEVGCTFAFYDLDTDKNVLDYLTYLKFSYANNEFEQTRPFDVRNLLYPLVLLCSIVTTGFALFNLPRTWMVIVYSMLCMSLQIVFAVRPFWRAIRRFLGREVDS